jgi:hypothetical protein
MQKSFQQEEQNAPSLTAVSTQDSATDTLQDRQVEAEQQAQTEPMEALLVTLKRLSRRHAWFGGIATLLGLLFGFFVLMGVLIYLMMSHMQGYAAKLILDFSLLSFGVTGNSGAGHAQMTVSGLTPLLLMLGSAGFSTLSKRERLKLTRTLAQYDDVRAVGPLVEALYLRDRVVRSEAAAALTRLLPRLRREDASLLNSNQRLYLWLYLGRSRWSFLADDDELSLAILQAYSQIGDGTELPTVRRLAQGKGSAGKDSRVREAAQRYLDEVKLREEQEKLPQILLRPSSGLETSPDTLLRPSEEGTETDPQHLLRASAADEAP